MSQKEGKNNHPLQNSAIEPDEIIDPGTIPPFLNQSTRRNPNVYGVKKSLNPVSLIPKLAGGLIGIFFGIFIGGIIGLIGGPIGIIFGIGIGGIAGFFLGISIGAIGWALTPKPIQILISAGTILFFAYWIFSKFFSTPFPK